MAHVSRAATVYARAAGLGVVAGLRSQLPFALLALAANRGRFAAGFGPPLGWLRSPAALAGFGLSAIGELIADKLPIVPSRHDLGPMAGRALFGGAAGAAIAHEAGHSAAVGAALGAVGGGLGADLGYHTRDYLGRVTAVPDPAWGAVEDGLALALGTLVVRPRKAPGTVSGAARLRPQRPTADSR